MTGILRNKLFQIIVAYSSIKSHLRSFLALLRTLAAPDFFVFPTEAGFAGFLGFLMSTFCFPFTLTFLTTGLVGSTGRRATFGLLIG